MKLLNRTIKSYLIYSVLALLLCTPLFYFSIQHLFIRQMDNVLLSHKTDFYQARDYLNTEADIKFFQLMNKEFILTPSPDHVAAGRDSLFSVDVFDSSTKQQIPYRVFSTRVTIQGKHYDLHIRESMINSTSLIAAIMGIQIIMLTLLLMGLLFINQKLSTKVWGPFYTILDRLKKYQIDKEGNLNLPQPSTAEFRDLSSAITQLVDNNYDVYINQKEFIENASHELQTPLAICRTKLELLAQTKDLTQEQADLIVHLLNAMDRITRLNKDLLLLSKIENRQFPCTEEINLIQVIHKSIEVYDRQAVEKRIIVGLTVVEPALINANPILIEVLINNLISNAIRHAAEEGTVAIKCTKELITVSNSGMPLEHPEKIFMRFHRESRTTVGSGLGLSIVKKICDVSGYHITYNYASAMHHFMITF